MDETSFPRGRGPRRDEGESGGSNSSKTKRSLSVGKTQDFLFGKDDDADNNITSNSSKSPRKKRKKSNSVTAAAAAPSTRISNKTSLMPLGGGGVVTPAKGPSWIEGLGFSKLAKGVKLLACVREVHADLAIFSLPNFWTGYMMRTSEKDVSCSDMLVAGQFVSVVIVKAVQEQTKEGVPRRRIQVSCLPAAVNPTGAVALKGNALTVPGMMVRCQVKSIEDHGVLMDLGAGRRGFLPYDEIQQDYVFGDEDDDKSDDKDERDSNGKLRLVLGRILDCLVRSANLHSKETAIVLLSLPATVAKQFLPATFTPKLSELQPGMLVHAKIESMVRNGLCVSFCSNVFRGAVEVQHTGGFWIPKQRHESEDWKAVFDHNRSVVARIIAVDASTKMVRLSLQQHVLELQSPPSLPPVGEVVQDAVVIRLDPGIGALLALPSDDMDEDDDDEQDEDDVKDRDKNRLFKPASKDKSYRNASRVRAVYVHISKAMDKEKNQKKTSDAAFAKEFAPSTKHRVRIMSTSNLIDGIASGAAASSIVNAHVLTHADLDGGKVYKQVPVCAQLDGGGVLVDLGTGVRGLIPQMHLFDKSVSNDYRNKMRKVKYSVGAKVDVRVLSVDTHTKKCLLTAKKSLVKAEDVINSFQNVQVGDIGTGFVSRVDDHGLSVTFFNGVYGRVTARSLAGELGIEDHKQDYHVGDVLQCRVTNIRKRSSRKSSHFVNESGDEMDLDEPVGSTRPVYRELTLSLKLDGESMQEDAPEEGKSPKKFQLRPGALLPAKSMLIVSLVKGKEKEHGFVPGYAIVRIKSKYLVDDNNNTEAEPYLECKLPFDQLLDHYRDRDIESASAMDAVAEKMLTTGKKINRQGFVLSDPKKSKAEYYSGIGSMLIVSIRPKLVETLSRQVSGSGDSELGQILPNPRSSLFKGALLQGYVAQVDKRHGAFVRYLNGLTGLVPKKKGGLLLPLYQTITTEVLAVDVTASPPKLLVATKVKVTESNEKSATASPVKVGDIINEATISKIDFHRAALDISDDLPSKTKIKARLHCTMAQSVPLKVAAGKPHKASSKTISKYHPFYQWEVGRRLSKLTVVSVEKKGDAYFVELTNRKDEEGANNRIFYEDAAQLSIGDKVSGIVTSAVEGKGLWLDVSPGLSCHIPALEVSTNVDILNNMGGYFPRGSRVECTVMDKAGWDSKRSKYIHSGKRKIRNTKGDVAFLSMLGAAAKSAGTKPSRGDLLVGHINRSLPILAPPALMLDLRGGYIGRCCITELEEPDNWTNMPLGREALARHEDQKEAEDQDNGSDGSVESDGSEEDSVAEKGELEGLAPDAEFPHRQFVQCRVLAGIPSKPVVEVSLRASRIEGDLDSDDEPEPDSQVQAYVVATTNKGCFLRLSQKTEGRVILKELCDGFLPKPDAAFPPGRLVVGKVKSIRNASKKGKINKKVVDLDMRESVLLESEEKFKFGDIEVGKKYKGSVMRIEDYGVFVRIDKSDISGLVHKSECSDSYIKNLSRLYDPGDLVKVLVLKKDEEKKQLGFSMKASHFVNDSDSDDGSSVGDDESMAELAEDSGADSDDENFVSKLAKSIEKAKGEEIEADSSDTNSDSSDFGSEDESENEDSDDNDVPTKQKFMQSMDTDVGFDWGGGKTTEGQDDDTSESEGETSDSEDEDGVHKSSHKSRRKQAQRRKEEQEITRREIALADGTADENPETAADFERLLASNPNSSEIWIKYMAFHLSLADVTAAREVASRAFERIEFREEREKLNVWCALLTLELKYGTESSLHETIGRACQQNNPKHVYLRVCEMLEKDPSASGGWEKVDEMYAKMCKKFKSKKKVWIAHMEYLLRSGRQEDAYSLSKRAMQSLPAFKHVETMSKFAQLVFEYGSPERARTLFDGLLLRYPKRLDIFFVYADKEVKHGEVSTARALFERAANPADETLKLKLSDKQMMSFFKKWYAFEEQHGTEETQENVKDTARRLVEQTTPPS